MINLFSTTPYYSVDIENNWTSIIIINFLCYGKFIATFLYFGTFTTTIPTQAFQEYVYHANFLKMFAQIYVLDRAKTRTI